MAYRLVSALIRYNIAHYRKQKLLKSVGSFDGQAKLSRAPAEQLSQYAARVRTEI